MNHTQDLLDRAATLLDQADSCTNTRHAVDRYLSASVLLWAAGSQHQAECARLEAQQALIVA